jgi:hypothetical protein
MFHSDPSTAPIRARLYQEGTSVAVQLPASLGLSPGEEVEIFIRRIHDWPPGFFDLEPSPEFPMPERTLRSLRP